VLSRILAHISQIGYKIISFSNKTIPQIKNNLYLTLQQTSTNMVGLDSRLRLRFFFLICFLWIFTAVQAQDRRATGLVFNKTQYKKDVKKQNLDGVSGTKARTMPVRINLRPFCPSPQDQSSEPSCATWATAYSAMTIHQAIQRKVTNVRDVDKIAYSKTFVFNQFCDTSDCIPPIEKVFEFLQKKGTCLAATFRNDVPMTQKPDLLAMNEAARFRLDTFMTVYDPDTVISLDKKITRFKRLLADSIPVIVGVLLPYSFRKINKIQKWRIEPNPFIDSSAHALCLIGYNNTDSTFELMNSWGYDWGDGGFVKVHYTDLVSMLQCAYTLKPHFEALTDSSCQSIEVTLRKAIKFNKRTSIIESEEIRVKYDAPSKAYKTQQKSWREGTGFQMSIRSAPIGWRFYAFGLSPLGEASIFSEGIITPEMIEKVIPAENNQLEIEGGGTEYMCLMFSKTPLSNFAENIKKLQKPTNKSFTEQIEDIFSPTLLVKPAMISERMGVQCLKNTDKTIALILNIN
jgi:hypothetical protein